MEMYSLDFAKIERMEKFCWDFETKQAQIYAEVTRIGNTGNALIFTEPEKGNELIRKSDQMWADWKNKNSKDMTRYHEFRDVLINIEEAIRYISETEI